MEKDKFYTVRGYQIHFPKVNQLTPAMEDYIEMIYRESLKKRYIRVNTLSELLNVKAPSTTKMLQRLKKLGFVEYEKYGVINLTEKGEKMGRFLLERHCTVEKFLRNLGVEESLLDQTELIEHNIFLDTLEKMKKFNKFLEENPEVKEKYQKNNP
ncbi:iron (metal) dependent repressor, DtxR family [Thermoanaerobacter uzonensis DSM 18761]|jgi:Mn-dependent DtxR family transcriptional regulator|uniref:Iron (Metal) dependent repressor, DtxR family n=1 Tax=Thermoanaerobacter uzonensis DSM 18761 TaxID=1123369 RepID=A0A1M4YQ28_9THEO|nr:iron dependent repressor, metal binding and dimerization domain protein [Thermoanaerobacter uzonensis]SHF07821.1 iron (metal) dependent repressor, DtxR family [Thermoanaerobacter uzonensis DSM 18761]